MDIFPCTPQNYNVLVLRAITMVVMYVFSYFLKNKLFFVYKLKYCNIFLKIYNKSRDVPIFILSSKINYTSIFEG